MTMKISILLIFLNMKIVNHCEPKLELDGKSLFSVAMVHVLIVKHFLTTLELRSQSLW